METRPWKDLVQLPSEVAKGEVLETSVPEPEESTLFGSTSYSRFFPCVGSFFSASSTSLQEVLSYILTLYTPDSERNSFQMPSGGKYRIRALINLSWANYWS